MSGSFGSAQWMYDSYGFYPYEIDQSLRFNRPDSAYLTRTPSLASNRKTWTWSGWVKRSDLVSAQGIFVAGRNVVGVQSTGWSIVPNGELQMYTATVGVSNEGFMKSAAVFRDPSAWYHLVLVIDSTQANQDDRVKAWVNGESITLISQGWYVQQNYDTAVNSTLRHDIGHTDAASINFQGYMAEVHFIDGQSLTPSSFAETKSGVWVPKEYEGTYGTNGFYLDFGNSGSLGADSSGNGNNWTPVNLAATDQVPDSPTNNFATFSTLIVNSLSLSEGNLRSIPTAFAVNGLTQGTQSVSSGKWYMEFDTSQGGTNGNCMVGVVGSSTYLNGSWFSASNGWAIDNNVDGNLYKRHNGTLTSLGARASSAVLLMVAVDLDAGKIWFGQNGTWLEGDPSAGTGASYEDVFLEVQAATYQYSNAGSGDVIIANFGQDSSFAGNKTAQGNTDANGIGDFYYAPPAGYLALCTANLPDSAIYPAQDDIPADYFNTVLYTGNGSTQSITGVGFQPDFTWIKARSSAYDHQVVDAIRGAGNVIYTNLTDSEGTLNTVSSFDSDGFTVNGTTYAGTNGNGTTFVAWNWLADNTSGSANTDGTITSTVSANQKAGFSIVSYTGNLSSAGTATVGHGLGVEPDMIIAKGRSSSSDWIVMHRDLASWSHNLFLNLTAAVVDTSTYGSRSVSASTFTTNYVTGLNINGVTQIAYCFHSVEGFSKFGSYTGNGSTDGPFIYTGFRPAFVMVKVVDLAGGHWVIHDSARDEHNESQKWLFPSSSSAEQTTTYSKLDFLSNGFKIRSAPPDNVNYSGNTFIYMAFAEMPFKYANAR